MAPNQPQNASREETVLNGTAGPQIVALSEGDGGEIIRLASWLIVAAILIGGLYVGQDVLIPLAISFLISFAMSPLVNWLTRRGLSRVLSVCVVMLTVGVFIAGLALLVTSQVRTISAELPTYQTTIRAKISDLASQMKGPGILDGALETVDTVQKEVDAAVHGQGEDAAQKVEVVPPPVSPFQTAQEWLTPAMAPLATTGIVLVFVFLVLLDRGDLRDRLIRLMGGNLHRSTDALEEAGRRISKYLLMQILVNIIYAIPMGLGLWLIGVPGALLWATLAAFMRFIPYVGPMLSALFPLSLAFAVDPGWNMVIWTLVLVVGLEAISGNVIEPMLYGTSTGLSAIALIAAATFWTALWGPVGLILSTPLTVCLLVIGRNLRQLQFLEILLGSEPVLDLPTRIYQRLIADDPEEAIEIASEAIAASSVAEFYNDTGIAVLRRTSEDYHLSAGPEHRLRVANGMETLLEELQEDFPAKAVEEAARNGRARIACIGGKWEIDATACVMLGHALALEGYPSMSHREGGSLSARGLERLDLAGIDVVCLSYFSDDPEQAARRFCRRLRQRWPQIKIILALWNAPAALLTAQKVGEMGADEVVTSIEEAVGRIARLVPPLPQAASDAEANDDAAPKGKIGAIGRTVAQSLSLGAKGGGGPKGLSPFAPQAIAALASDDVREELEAVVKRAADVFDVKYALIAAVDSGRERLIARSRDLPGYDDDDEDNPFIRDPAEEGGADQLPDRSFSGPVIALDGVDVVPDTERDPDFADHPALKRWHQRLYAGAPLLDGEGRALGAFCLLDPEPRQLDEGERELLGQLAEEVAKLLIGEEAVKRKSKRKDKNGEAGTMIVGQQVPE